ncbi:MAG TPA: SurA N-terminal domain-containing protein [Candidatus Azoamicus sp.]
MIIKKIFIWFTILFISIALIITGFTTNPKNNKNNEYEIKISNKTINNSDITNIITVTKKNIKKISNINDINIILKNLIIKNITTNILSEKNKANITKYELLKNILNIHEFNKNDKFSETLYNDFLKKNRLTELEFQTKLIKNLKKIHINNGLNIIKNTYEKKIKNLYKTFYKNKINNINNYKTIKKTKFKPFYVHNKKITYIDLSIKNYITNLKIKFKKINNFNNNLKFQILTCYIIKNNKIKKIYLIIEKNKLYKKIKKKIYTHEYLINKNIIIIKSDKFLITKFNKSKKEIINLKFKNKSINNIISIKKYIKKKIQDNSIKYELLLNKKKYIFLHSNNNALLNLNYLNEKNIKNYNYFIIKDEEQKKKIIIKYLKFFIADIFNEKKYISKHLIKKKYIHNNPLLILKKNKFNNYF